MISQEQMSKPVEQWTLEEVDNWLQNSLATITYDDEFHVDGDCALHFTKDKILEKVAEEIGITNEGDVRRFVRAFESMAELAEKQRRYRDSLLMGDLATTNLIDRIEGEIAREIDIELRCLELFKNACRSEPTKNWFPMLIEVAEKAKSVAPYNKTYCRKVDNCCTTIAKKLFYEADK